MPTQPERPSSIPVAKEFLFPGAPIDDDAWAAREQEFFRSIQLSNGTYKTTYARRLDTLNVIANAVLPRDRRLELMDVAVSSGIATLEWIQSLRAAGIDFEMTAGDLCVRAFLLSFGRFGNVLVDRTGYPLQFDFFGRAIPSPPPRRLALRRPPLFIGVHALRWIVPILFERLFNRMAERREVGVTRRYGMECRATALVSPRLSREGTLTILDDDLLLAGSFENRFDAIRAANVLNRTYFDDETLRTMIANLRARLRCSGVLIVCRTHDDGVNHGTVFRLNADSELEIVCRIGDGSEIEDLVTRYSPRTVRDPEISSRASRIDVH